MYSRDYHTEGVPPGYGGSAFLSSSGAEEEPDTQAPPRESEPVFQKAETDEPPCKETSCAPRGCSHRPSLFGKWKFPGMDGLFSSDLILIALSLLLLTGRGDDCEEKDDDFWLLLLLIFFMK
ncbi:MAG: hypothetical protein PUJ21_04670 [Clostridia bacterium]|nr:hypothetical protein [Clostridia bacterium]MDY6183846.1 hypothetical protein [Eubacteriales bacterium]